MYKKHTIPPHKAVLNSNRALLTGLYRRNASATAIYLAMEALFLGRDGHPLSLSERVFARHTGHSCLEFQVAINDLVELGFLIKVDTHCYVVNLEFKAEMRHE